MAREAGLYGPATAAGSYLFKAERSVVSNRLRVGMVPVGEQVRVRLPQAGEIVCQIQAELGANNDGKAT